MENQYENKFYEGIVTLGAITSLIAGISLAKMDFKPLKKFLNPEYRQEQIQTQDNKQIDSSYNYKDFMHQRFAENKENK